MLKNKKISIKQFIILWFMVLSALIMIILGFVSYRDASEYTKRIAYENLNAQLNDIQNILSNELKKTRKLTNYVAIDDYFSHNVYKYNNTHDSVELMNSFNNISRYMHIYYFIIKNTKSVIVSTKKDTIIFDKYQRSTLKLNYDEVCNALNIKKPNTDSIDTLGKIENKKINDYDFNGYYYVSEIYYNNELQGNVIFFVSPGIIDDLFLYYPNIVLKYKDDIVYKGQNITSQDIDVINNKTNWEDANYYAGYNNSYMASLGNNSEVFDIFIKDENVVLKRQNSELIQTFLISIVITFVISLIITSVVSKSMTKPLIKLSKYIKEYRIFNKQKSIKLQNKKTNHTVRERFSGYFFVIIIIPVLLFQISSFYITRNTIYSCMNRSREQTLIQASNNLMRYSDYADEVLKYIALNGYVQTKVEEGTLSGVENVEEFMLDILSLHDKNNDIYIYNTDRELVLSNKYAESETNHYNNLLIDKLEEQDTPVMWADLDYGTLYNSSYHIILRKINHLHWFNRIGYIVYYTPKYDAYNFISNIQADTTSIDINSNAQPPKGVITKEKNGTTTKSIDAGIWTLTAEYSKNDLKTEIESLLVHRLIALLIVLFATLALSYLFSGKIADMIKKITVHIPFLSIKNIEAVFPENLPINEINQLSQAFNECATENEELLDQLINSMHKLHDLENKRNKAELVAMQCQIRPHFLYNNFESLSWLIKSSQGEKACTMLKSLSNFFRYVASARSSTTTLDEEIKIAHEYIRLVNMRFNDKIKLQIDIDESLHHLMLPKMTIQPLLENSVNHGFKLKESECHIHIRGVLQGRDAVIIIEDDGIGIKPSLLETINKTIETGEKWEEIGVYNINSRISLLCGKNYGLKLSSVHGKSTKVTITLPFKKA